MTVEAALQEIDGKVKYYGCGCCGIGVKEGPDAPPDGPYCKDCASMKPFERQIIIQMRGIGLALSELVEFKRNYRC
jgi:hypothetical protein